MSEEVKNLLHIGADLDYEFVSQFRAYCRANDFKQKALLKRLIEWWLSQDFAVQTAVYHGNWIGPLSPAAVDDQTAAARNAAKKRRNQRQRPAATL